MGSFPGGHLIVVIGAIVFMGYNTNDNYGYTHSFWHVCIALSICFFLRAGNINKLFPLGKDSSSYIPGTAYGRLSTSSRYGNVRSHSKNGFSSNEDGDDSEGIEDAAELSDYRMEGYCSEDVGEGGRVRGSCAKTSSWYCQQRLSNAGSS